MFHSFFLFLALALLLPFGALAQTASPASLFEAAGKGNITAITALLAQGANVNARDAHGNTALAWAELSGDPDTIEARNKIEDRKPRALGPFLWLHPLELGHLNAVALLVNHGADVNAKDSHYGQTPLIWATKRMAFRLVKLLLDKGADRTIQDKEGQTALTATLWDHSPELIMPLIDWGVYDKQADLNVPDRAGRTPLMYAAILNDVPHLTELVRRGARVNAANHFGDTALMKAAEGHDASVVFLLSQAAIVNIQDKGGWSPLLAASRFGRPETMKLLLDAGANPNLGSDPNNETPLMAAVETGDRAKIALLLDKGAEVNLADPNVHRTALIIACQNSQREAALLLLDRGAKANIQSKLGETPLAYACGSGQIDLVKRLLEGGADPNVRAKWGGETALYWAAQGGQSTVTTYPEIVGLLLAHGAEVNAKTDSGETMLQAARRSHQAEIIALLQKAGATD